MLEGADGVYGYNFVEQFIVILLRQLLSIVLLCLQHYWMLIVKMLVCLSVSSIQQRTANTVGVWKPCGT